MKALIPYTPHGNAFGVPKLVHKPYALEITKTRQYNLSLGGSFLLTENDESARPQKTSWKDWQPNTLLFVIWLAQSSSYSYKWVTSTEKLNYAQPSRRFTFTGFDSQANYVNDAHAARDIAKAWFDNHANRWEKETAIHSAPGATYLHRDYMAIIAKAMDNPECFIPLILNRITEIGGDWFFALEQITGENPAKNCEDYEDAIKAWNAWSKSHGMIEDGDVVSRA